MLDQPDAPTLLRAMASTLSDEVLPSTSGATRHAVRVVANLCLVLEREFRAGLSNSTETQAALATLLDHKADLSTLVAELDLALPHANDAFRRSAHQVLLADVERRLVIDKPGYGS